MLLLSLKSRKKQEQVDPFSVQLLLIISSSAVLRAVKINCTLLAARSSAKAFPIPDEAPVIKIVFPEKYCRLNYPDD